MGRKVCLVFDRSCPFTTGMYLERAAILGGLEVSAKLQAGDDRKTPVMMVDDSSPWTPEKEWVEGFPSRAFWAIDTHTAYDRCLAIAGHFPLVFAAQRDGAERLKSDGVNAHWLPLAADEEQLQAGERADRNVDVAFVGNARTPERRALLRLVGAAFDSFAFDNSEDPAKIVELYGRAKIVINHSIKDDVNMRIFEAAACGAVPVTNVIPPAQWKGLDLKHVGYDDPGDALDKIETVLTDDALRESIRTHNMDVVRARHLYEQRLNAILHALDGAD